MSHPVETPETAAPGRTRSYRGGFTSLKNSASQVVGITKVASRLGPKQVKDELQIAKVEMIDKGKKFGVGAALVVVGLVFLLLAAIALVAAAIDGLAHALPDGLWWLSALIVAVFFLILLAIFALVGVSKIKKQLPLKPESAIFGLLYDLGVAKEGSQYTATRVRREMREKDEAKEAEKAEKKRKEQSGEVPAEPAPTQDQLEQRTKARRDHLKVLRDDLGRQTRFVRTEATGLADKGKTDVKDTPNRAKGVANGFAANVQDPEALKARWKPLTALAVSVGAFFVFLGRLIKR